MSKRHKARGFGGAVVAKNETPPKEISEAVAIERMSKESLEALRQQGFTSKQAAVLNEKPAVEEETPEVETVLSLSKEELTAIAKMAAEAATKPFEEKMQQMQAELDAANQKAEEDKAAIAAEKQAAEDKLAVFNNLFKLNGNPEPVQEEKKPVAVNTHVKWLSIC
jgi:uncharacterized membrane protein YccC